MRYVETGLTGLEPKRKRRIETDCTVTGLILTQLFVIDGHEDIRKEAVGFICRLYEH
jgi:hypothetical protein